ncbi:molybdopterin-synthase adenylyltransferase MoeB [Plasticicumulans sp.]|uniref:HesA/MoeB/ThiF family protein n=1 Tax=Plasticicumulans sp. TaxID=2307179 RepID=UPI002D05883E|nr:molybdopterin-synthase adenylyltransferase MoeB [Plasticicumulans sp.]HMX53240.1 molybdopterin-synthase adenylyltransferase MoeB [Plasticicumulans sp.]HMZ11948.1 molybdopterin-synthase adenylyltransferase MoeB [Plasticicumulans sp.]HNE02240.1 molybdopterin-synthase adenylyltransferase MoeB [Plasticicumulans sp.]HNG49685.1 molybdopterin-synthase adenylyltransferase MoeB [Plasticicumulans sp.]HNM43133.1 molybdopterin-synthase adenylyltransferase MoeB [Plasticicumulans sp.]
MNDEELLRYSRQIMLPEIDIEGQERLRAATALVIGLGGLGSPVAMYLGAAGVGRLLLVDFDHVDTSNLQRQIAHAEADIGRPKVESARDRVRALNPLVAIETIAEALDDEALAAAVARADVVLDCTDNLTTRLAINAACVAAGRPLVTGAAIRMEGQAMVVDPRVPEAPCYRCLYRSAEEPAESCTQSGVLAPVVGIIGSLQAVEAIKVLTGAGEPLTGRLLLMDARTMEFHEVRVPKYAGCPVCGTQSG